MSGTSCPSCDAPAPSRARRCPSCGYGFVEDGPPARRPPLWPLPAAGAVLAIAGAGVAILSGGGTDEASVDRAPATPRLQVISERPLSSRAVEAAIEQVYVPLRDDDTAYVSCSGREAKPAHSVRRCEVRYPNGVERRVVVLTTARGNEVLSKP